MVAQLGRCQTRLFGARDRTRDIDQHPFAIFTQARPQRWLEFSTLRANARDKEPETRRSRADAGKSLCVRGADDEADVIARIPGLSKIGDVFL